MGKLRHITPQIRRLLAQGKQQSSRFFADERLIDKFRLPGSSKPSAHFQEAEERAEELPAKTTKAKSPTPVKNAPQQPDLPKGARGKQAERSESEFQDLNQILQQNLNINNVNLDGDGNVNDFNPSQKPAEEEDFEQAYEGDQDALERMFKLKENVQKYWKQSNDLQQKKMRKEQKGWDLKFQNYWGYLVQADKNLQDSMTLAERFFDHVGKFRRTTEALVREIVDELHLPQDTAANKHLAGAKTRHIPLQRVPEELTVFLDDEDTTASALFFYEKNICVKLTHQGDAASDAGLSNTTQNNRTSHNMQNSADNSYMAAQAQGKNADPFQNLKWKQYGREFLSMDVMFDALFLLSKPDAAYKLRVPLAALVDYKGFRALAVAAIPIQPGLGPSIGFYTDGKYVPHDQKLKQELVFVGDVLNLKENRVAQKGAGHQGARQFESVPLSFFVKVYNYQQPESKSKGKDPDTPTKKSQEYHFSELQYQEEPFYVLKTSEIFPHDVDLNEVHPRKDKHLRPEFVCVYERPLKADARKDLGAHKDSAKSKDDDVSPPRPDLPERPGGAERSLALPEEHGDPAAGEPARQPDHHAHRQREPDHRLPLTGRQHAIPRTRLQPLNRASRARLLHQRDGSSHPQEHPQVSVLHFLTVQANSWLLLCSSSRAGTRSSLPPLRTSRKSPRSCRVPVPTTATASAQRT